MENTMKQELKTCQRCGMPMQEEQYRTRIHVLRKKDRKSVV